MMLFRYAFMNFNEARLQGTGGTGAKASFVFFFLQLGDISRSARGNPDLYGIVAVVTGMLAIQLTLRERAFECPVSGERG